MVAQRRSRVARQVAADLDKLEQGTAGALATAQAWVADEYAGLRLRHAADLALQRLPA
jgi:DNA polymerase-3 subunit delta'